MANLRFKVGEIAILAVSSKGREGEECTITAIRHAKRGSNTDDGGKLVWDTDYWGHFSFGVFSLADWQLRKKNPPSEPASLTRQNGIEEEA